jgi:hypothetical protein
MSNLKVIITLNIRLTMALTRPLDLETFERFANAYRGALSQMRYAV